MKLVLEIIKGISILCFCILGVIWFLGSKEIQGLLCFILVELCYIHDELTTKK